MYYVYIVKCSDGTLYTGYTTEIERRIEEHNLGQGARYTRGRTPVTLMHQETFSSKSKAMKREYAIKSLSRQEKQELISQK